MDEDPPILRVDFTRRKLVSRDSPQSTGPDITAITEKTADAISNLNLYKEAIVLVGRFRLFQEMHKGKMRGNTYDETSVNMQNLPIEELMKLLDVNEKMWREHPQHYHAIANLVESKIPPEAEEAHRPAFLDDLE